jgi:hypothetical protein
MLNLVDPARKLASACHYFILNLPKIRHQVQI